MDGLDGAPADPGRRPDQAVQAGVVDHPDDRGHAAALLAHEPAAHAAELHLGGGERAGAELVLQALDLEAGVAPSIRKQDSPAGAWASVRKTSHDG